ncbi:MAG: ABC transporter ATP-binding protein [Gammaproteobacteria bacterium]|nr:ABC transporter ATP-binding protein [Gammaproteobacteria bacterium]
MFNRLFSWIESLVDPFPPEPPAVPPRGLVEFCWHYTKPFWPLLLAATVLSASIALLEVFLFAFLGDLVDLLAGAERANFWQTYGDRLLWMAALALIALPLLNFISEAVVHQGLRGNFSMRGKLSEAQADMRSLVTGRVVDSYTNIPTVKLFAHADREDAYAKEGMEWMLSAVYRSMRMATLLTATLQALSGFLIFGMGAMSVWLWHEGNLSTGAIAFAVGLTLRMQGMSQWIIWEIATLFEDVGVVQDGIESIARERAIKDAATATPLAVSEGAIRFEGVTFNYGKPVVAGQAPVIDRLTLDIAPGEKVGLVGRSGAGKSTLTNLLLRFYDIEQGRILVDGRDIATVTQDSLRASIGVVTQDTSLLHRSVLENIRYGKPEATLAEVDSAARKAHADEFIAALVDPAGRRGFEAHVGERGVKLSGGQRQRIAIARVLLKNAPILVLDEATSALDSEVEQAIQENLYALMEGKTVIAVAHRLSTIAAMDRLVIMDKGIIVEQGTHRELLDRGGLYATLWQRQSGGFLVDPPETPSTRQGTNQ